MLAYPKVSEPFYLYTSACGAQVGGMLMQNEKTLATHSTKLNEAQQKYPATDKELLAIQAKLDS